MLAGIPEFRWPLRVPRVRLRARPARLAELVDASDLKSELPKGRCRFESGSGHQNSMRRASGPRWAGWGVARPRTERVDGRKPRESLDRFVWKEPVSILAELRGPVHRHAEPPRLERQRRGSALRLGFGAGFDRASAASLASRSSRSRATFAATASRSFSRCWMISSSCFLRFANTASALSRAVASRSAFLIADLRWSRRLVALALHALAQGFSEATCALALLPSPPLRWLLVRTAAFHLAKETLALHLLLEDAQRAVHVVVAHEHLHELRPRCLSD